MPSEYVLPSLLIAYAVIALIAAALYHEFQLMDDPKGRADLSCSITLGLLWPAVIVIAGAVIPVFFLWMGARRAARLALHPRVNLARAHVVRDRSPMDVSV